MSAEFQENNLLGWFAVTDPEAIDDYNINWSKWLESNSLDVIVSSEWFTHPGVTVGIMAFDGGSTTIWLGPCSPGEHKLTNRVNTVQGRRMDQSFTLVVRDA